SPRPLPCRTPSSSATRRPGTGSPVPRRTRRRLALVARASNLDWAGCPLQPLLLLAVLERRAQDVAQRRTRVRRTIGCHGFLLFGDFQRLDRERDPLRLLVVGH